jgi:hypothetical protein
MVGMQKHPDPAGLVGQAVESHRVQAGPKWASMNDATSGMEWKHGIQLVLGMG